MNRSPRRTLLRLLCTGALAGPLAALALAGCASAPGGTPVATAAPTPAPALDRDATLEDETASNYGLFLAGEAAMQRGRSEDAARYFSRAAAGAGDKSAADQALIREKAFEAAVMSGDISRAAELAPPPGAGPVESPAERLARLVRAVDALAEGRGKEANALLKSPGGGVAFSGGLILVKPWAAAAAGDAEGAVTQSGAPAPRLTRLSSLESQAMLLERAKRYDEAETDYKSLTSNPQLGSLYIASYGAFLERRGRQKDAVALYTDALSHSPNDRDLKQALDRASSGKRPPAMLSLKQGAAKALTAAAELALVDKQINEGEVYLRLALKLDPAHDEAWVLLGDIRASADQPQLAREAYGHVATSSPAWPEARQRIVASYQSEGDNATALKLTQELIKAQPDDRDALVSEADLLRASNRFDEAVTVLDKLIATSNHGGNEWALYFERGTALDRSGHWDDAEKDLLKALSLQPDEPDVLNYLGYSWVIKGQRLQQAMSMLQKAYLAQPDSGEIADSLGWAYYNLGDFKAAVQRLERAVSLAPINPEINDHLGDAYWRAGRKTEAQFQWSRVLTLNPDDDLKAAAQKKLAAGLGPLILPGGTRS